MQGEAKARQGEAEPSKGIAMQVMAEQRKSEELLRGAGQRQGLEVLGYAKARQGEAVRCRGKAGQSDSVRSKGAAMQVMEEQRKRIEQLRKGIAWQSKAMELLRTAKQRAERKDVIMDEDRH